MDRHIIIFDWDNTLYPTTYLDDLVSVDTDILKKLELNIIKLLGLAREKGNVHIVTNAQTGWIELCTKRNMPLLKDFLDEKNIPLISARSLYEELVPNNPMMWKFHAMKRCINIEKGFERNYHVMSIGDSIVEKDALANVMYDFPISKTKYIKLCDKPNIEQLNIQLNFIVDYLDYICDYDDDLDISCEKILDLLNINGHGQQRNYKQSTYESTRLDEDSYNIIFSDVCNISDIDTCKSQ
jgi:hypothetical protein